MKKTISLAALVLLGACRPAEQKDTTPDSSVVPIASAPQPAPVATSPALRDIVETTKEMNDTIENCVGPALGLNFKKQVCEAPPSACQ